MKATEFVGKFGICEANKAIDKFGCTGFYCHQYKVFKVLIERSFCDRKDNIHTIDMSQVKQIVDAWELVERFGDLRQAKLNLEHMISHNQFEFCATNIDELQNAISLVEQCQ